MEAVTFLTLPAEIHISIARYCKNHDLINLCLTSKLVNERCLHVLYRLVDFQYGRHGLGPMIEIEKFSVCIAQVEKQVRFHSTLKSHPEYGKHVRILESNVSVPISESSRFIMQSLTHLQHVDLAFQNFASYPAKHFPAGLFQSVTSVRFVGQIQYSLAKLILNAINPATLKHLCLDLVPDLRIGGPPPKFVPRDGGEKPQTIALAVAQRLLTPLTGRFTALQTLILRRITKPGYDASSHAAAEEESYIEWASFIHSVQRTVQKFMFEQVADLQFASRFFPEFPPQFEIMDERFRRLVLPTIVSGNWPCLHIIELRGIRSSNGQGELAQELRAALGGNAKIVVKEEPDSTHRYMMPYRWN